MKRKNAFTLIELLAVIVVLAIIALIATPIVMNTIKKSQKGAAERSAENYIDAVETVVAEERLSKNEVLEGEYQITSDGNLCRDKSASCSDDKKIKIEMNGTKPTSGKIKITNGTVDQSSSSMTIGDYSLVYSDNKWTAMKVETYRLSYDLKNVSGEKITAISNAETKTLKFTANEGYRLPEGVTVSGATSVWDKETGTLILSKVTGDVTITVVGEKLPYVNGEVVYFNVTTGEKCSLSDYTETQSNTGVKEGCMKFYAFNDDGKDTVNLILDHNTTQYAAWNSSGSNSSGPKDLLDQLKKDTRSWKGTITPANYTIDQTGQTSNAKYTIDYSGYKARLITAQEVAVITGNTTWDEKVSTNTDYYYFDSKTKSASDTCKFGDTSGCQYGWLYDRTTTGCTKYGCLNDADSSMNGSGYWTASSCANKTEYAWSVKYDARISINSINNTYFGCGVRPVIEVLKSKLK